MVKKKNKKITKFEIPTCELQVATLKAKEVKENE